MLSCGPQPGGPSSGGLQAENRQWQVVGGAELDQQVGRHVQAGTAGGAAAGAHRQLGHAHDTALGGFADLMVGNPVADADVHVRTRQAGPDRPAAIPIEMRMVVNFEPESFAIRFRAASSAQTAPGSPLALLRGQ